MICSKGSYQPSKVHDELDPDGHHSRGLDCGQSESETVCTATDHRYKSLVFNLYTLKGEYGRFSRQKMTMVLLNVVFFVYY